MHILNLLYAAPALLFLVVAGMWYVGGGLPKWIAALPVAACYVMAAVLLFMGGCQPVAHVRLEGVEADLVDASGKPREISLGSGEEIPSLAGIQIPGFPQDSLRVRLDRDSQRLRLLPGTGYQRGLLVRTEDGLLPLEPGGLPRLLPLQDGDQLHIADTAGGEVIVSWRLGDEKFDLTPGESAMRWIGSSGQGLARLANAPARLFGLKVSGTRLEIERGAEFPAEHGLTVNGIRLAFDSAGKTQAVYQPGLTELALVGPDAAAGRILFRESGRLAFEASLFWQAQSEVEPAFDRTLEAGRSYRLGGALEDDLFVRGLPSSALELVVMENGRDLELRLTETGREAFEKGQFHGQYPQQGSLGGPPLRIGVEKDPAGGLLTFQSVQRAEVVEDQVSLTEVSDDSAVAETASDATAAAASGEAESTDLSVTSEQAVALPTLRCIWVPNTQTHWVLPNREITLPLANYHVSLGQRRPWAQSVFPLAGVTPRASGVRSCIVYGQDHPHWINGASLLLLEPGIEIGRDGQPLAAVPMNQPPGLLPPTGQLDFLEVQAERQGGRFGAVTGDAWHPASVWEAQRVVLRKRFARFELTQRTVGTGSAKQAIPVLRARFVRPAIQSLPLADVEDALQELNEDAVDVQFGLNDLGGFSQLPHQVRFRELTSWFNSANADVTLKWLRLMVQDDFRRQELKYGEPFLVGGDRRLMLTVIKHDRPWNRIALVLGAGLAAFVIAVWGAGRFGWVSLMFGVAFITCSRVLFGHAAQVNPPYNDEVIRIGLAALWLVPLGLGGWAMVGRQLLPGRIEGLLERMEQGINYWRLTLLAIAGLLLRVGLLAAGFKEAIPLGPVRLALSIGFVPFYLLLFALAFFILWRDKAAAGGLFDWKRLRPFILCTAVLSICQAIAAILVSDLGLMLYFIPQALVMAGIGAAAGIEGLLRWLRRPENEPADRPWQIAIVALVPSLPLLLMMLVFLTPGMFLSVVPGLAHRMSDSEDLITDSTLLRVLQFADKDYLMGLGTDTAERIAQDHAIMENYAHRGLFGEGYLGVHIVSAKYVTALNDNVSAVFVLAQFGVVGALALLLAYLAVPAAAASDGPRSTFTSWLALTAGLSFSLVSIYMIGANYGFLPFTGRNMYLLGLNSWSDVVESLILLGCIVLHRIRMDFLEEQRSTRHAAVLDQVIRGDHPPIEP